MYKELFNKYQQAYNHYISNGRKMADWFEFGKAYGELCDFVAKRKSNKYWRGYGSEGDNH